MKRCVDAARARRGTSQGAPAVADTARRDELTARLRDRGASIDIRDRTELLTNRVIDGMVTTLPVYANAPEPFLEVTRIVVGRIVDQVTRLFTELRLPTRQEVRELVEFAVPPTDQGVTLEDMLRVFRLAQDVLWGELHRLVDAGELDDPQAALELSQLGVSLISELSRGVTAAYLQGDRVWLRRRDAERALVGGVLGMPPRIEEATRAANALDLPLLGSWRAGVYAPTADGTLDALAETLTDARITWGLRGAIAVEGEAVVVVTTEDELLPPPDGARVGIGAPGDGPAGMRRSHDEARDALAVAARRGVARLDVTEARLGRVVMGSLPALGLADEVLAPVDAEPDARREMLTETLAAYLDEQGSPSATARRLQLHVQSTRYRIEQLREVLGDEVLDDPDRRLELHLALRARSLAPQSLDADDTAPDRQHRTHGAPERERRGQRRPV